MEHLMRCFCLALLLLGVIHSYQAQNCPTQLTNLTNTTVFITDPENCRNYSICSYNYNNLDNSYQCTNQVKMECPEDYCFDKDINACTFRDGGSCSPHTFFPDCDNCTKYWQCANGRKVHMICPKDLWFNYNDKRCDYIRNYPIQSGCGYIKCTEGPDRRKYSVEGNNTLFIWCLEKRAYLYTCLDNGPNYIFDEDMQYCKNYEITNFIVKEKSPTIIPEDAWHSNWRNVESKSTITAEIAGKHNKGVDNPKDGNLHPNVCQAPPLIDNY